MSAALTSIVEPFQFDQLEQMTVANGVIGRLLLAALLGGLVGLVRELSRKSAGIRTNLLICMASAFFTMLSPILAGAGGSNKGQVASNIVQGIGFLGAGLILHNRSRVSGLASAASIWVVASIGMACGAGLYAAASAGALIVVIVLALVGFLEQGLSLKTYPVTYEARGHDQIGMMQSIIDSMDQARQRLMDVDTQAIGELQRISFSLAATKRQHERLHADLNAKPAIDELLTFRDPEDD
jgi:putative Mg2+ transporter-C (MgtC) family protein